MTIEYLKKAGKTAATAEHSGATRLFPQGRGVRMGFKGYLRRHDAIHGNSGDRVDFNHLLPANHISGYRNIFTVNNGS